MEFGVATIKVTYGLKNNIGKKVKSSLILKRPKLKEGKDFILV
jgi:hypothetical protein